jgi:hypothetical protein
MGDKVSTGAKEIAESFLPMDDYYKSERQRLAEYVDSHLSELIEAAEDAVDAMDLEGLDCSVETFSAALAKWRK